MRKEDVLPYVNRDWDAIARMKRRSRVEMRSRMTAGDALRMGDSLRRYAHSLHPDWPTEEHRREDLLVHVRVSESLGRVKSRNG